MTDRSHYRKAERNPVAVTVRFRRDRAGASLVTEGVTYDLGVGGAYIETSRPLAAGERVILILDSPSTWDPLKLTAEVRWASRGDASMPDGFGVRFLSLTNAQATAILNLTKAETFEGAS